MKRRRLAGLSAAVALGLVAVPAIADAAATALTYPTCVEHETAVSLAPGRPADQRLVGWLCSNGSPSGKTLQILVPGYTYDHRYWNPGLQRDRYSYVRAATRAGYATYAIDRLGTGASRHPPAAAVGVPTHAWALHQLVQRSRAGEVTGTPVGRVVVVGHSMGSAVAQVEAARFHDVDAVILSDWLHVPARGAARVFGTSVPAQRDPDFRDAPPGYTTTLAGTRSETFYNEPAADPAMIAYDEQVLKSTGTVAEEATVVPTVRPGVTRRISVPVLLAVAEHDAIFCGPLTPCHTARQVRARERVFFSAAACLQTYVLPRAGHSINLHRAAADWFAVATSWTSQVAPPEAAAPAPGCGAFSDSG